MKAIIPTELKKRISDRYGEGHFGASRSKTLPDGTVKKYKHKGQDYLCPAESLVLAPVAGKIIKNGYPYADDLSFRYVRIRTRTGEDHTVMYVDPILPVGREVKEGTVIGSSQDLTERYPGIGNHVHYGISINGSYVDPDKYHEDLT